jgi:hypothetical protein
MSYDYDLIGWFPFDAPEAEAVNRAAAVLGVPVTIDPDGDPRFAADGLLVYGVTADDEELEETRKSFGFENNLTLVFVDSSHGNSDMMIRVMQNLLKVVFAFTSIPGFRAVLIADYNDDTFLASIQDGQVTLNKDYWESWEAASEVLAVIPEPHRMMSLHLLKGSN